MKPVGTKKVRETDFYVVSKAKAKREERRDIEEQKPGDWVLRFVIQDTAVVDD